MSLQYNLFPEEEFKNEKKSGKEKNINKKPNPNPPEIMKDNNEKELDLRDVFSAIGRFFTNSINAFKRNILHTLLFVKRHKKIIGSITILGIVLGLCYSILGKPYYTATMAVKSNDSYLEKNIFTKILEELNTMCDEEDYNELARILNISVEHASAIRSFELEEEKEVANLGSYYAKYMKILSTIADEDKREEMLQTFIKSEKDNIYYISVSVYNDSILPLLNEPFAKLINANPYFVRKREINQTAMEFNEQKIYDELLKLDSLKKTLTEAIQRQEKYIKSGSNNVILGEQQLYNPLPVYDKYISLYGEAIALKKQILLNEFTMDVLSGFVKLAKNTRLNPILSALLGAGIGFGSGILLTLFLIGLQRFNALEEKNLETAA